MTAKKAFTKGEEVTLFGNYDSKGTMYFKRAIVLSCGAKRMVLTDADSGKELGRNFKPVRATEEESVNRARGLGYEAVFPRLSEEDTSRIGLALAGRMIKEQTAHYEECLSRHADYEGYCNAIRKEAALLHEPRVVDYTSK